MKINTGKLERPKLVYAFGGGSAEGDASMNDLLGDKGANLAEMARLGLPVPPGFTVSTDVCTYLQNHGCEYPSGLRDEVSLQLERVEQIVGRRFGGASNPLLLAIRSGAPVSMPGMMDSVLNVGLNDETVEGIISLSRNPRFAYDCYRRLVLMYGHVVAGLKQQSRVESDLFEEILERKKRAHSVKLDTELSADDLRELVAEFKAIIFERKGIDFPKDPHVQLWSAISAVFGSWNNARAVRYRRLNNIPELPGTAVNVQAMVFGNLEPGCASGVVFTRNPATGENQLYGEFLFNAQGEDVVAGSRTPQQITIEEARHWAERQGIPEATRAAQYPSLEEINPRCYSELLETCRKIERHYKEMQDIEFTVEKDKLWILQTRTAKRTTAAAVKIAVEMVKEGEIDKKTAILRVSSADLNHVLHRELSPNAPRDLLTKGLPASPGAVTGEVVFSIDDAQAAVSTGRNVVLVRIETSPEDIDGVLAAQGILTARGGVTSHAAVIARALGKCCVVGAGDIRIDYARQQFTVNDRVVRRYDQITLDGSSGEVFVGSIPTVEPKLSGDLATFMGWIREFRG